MKAYNLGSDSPLPFPNDYRVLHSTVLSRTDLKANNNKFYVLEIHEAAGKYRLFTNYGRVGAEGSKEGRYADCLDDVMAEYDRLLREKTNLRKGYVAVEVERATVGSASLRTTTERAFQEKHIVKRTQIHPDIARFIEHIYDESRSELVRRIETPLGSLSKKQIEHGADALRSLRFAIARNHPDMILSLTNQYYSLVPHRLGRTADINDLAINTVEKADTEEELLQLMRDVYHVQNDMEAEVDRKYRALGAQIEVMSPDTRDYRRVERKILRTQSHRHSFRLKVNRIFQTCVPEERASYEQTGPAVRNVQELFHGTKNSNMVGILSRGLLIAPKNAPVTGYMFGKGVYFADQSSKSAQYSLMWANNRPTCGYLFLADVALGRIHKENCPKYREEAPDGFDSVQGCKGPSLIHNEFIIYKTAQCTLRYIAEIEQV